MRIALIDDHPMILRSTETLINESFESVRIEKFKFPRQAKNHGDFDIIVLDLEYTNGETGFEFINYLKGQQNASRILVFTTHHTYSILKKLKNLEVDGYVNKVENNHILSVALSTILEGDYYWSPFAINVFKKRERLVENQFKPNFLVLSGLTPREREIAENIKEGYSLHEVSERLNIGIETVRTHKKSLLKKTGNRSVEELRLVLLESSLD